MTIVVHSASDLAVASCLAEQKLPIQTLLSEREHASVRIHSMSFEQAFVPEDFSDAGAASRYYWILKLKAAIFKDECWSGVRSWELTPEQAGIDARYMRDVLRERYPEPAKIEPRIGKDFGRSNARQIHISFVD